MNACTTTNVVQGCFNGTPVLIHVTDDGLGKSATRIIDLNGDIVVGANAGNTFPGECVIPQATEVLRTEGQNIASGTFTTTFFPTGGPVATWSHSAGNGDLQSVTVTAQRAGLPSSGNTVRITFPSGRVLYLLQGETKTWSVAQDFATMSESLEASMVIETLGNAAAAIAWTVQV